MKRTESQTLTLKEHQNHDYIHQLQSKFSKVSFKRLEKTEAKYNSVRRTTNLENDSIFKETQIKKSLSALQLPLHQATNLRKKFLYFSQGETKDDLYKHDPSHEVVKKEKFSIQYIGHSTLLIQYPGFNILTDPIFYGLDRLYYPEKTKSLPCIQFLPKVDVILISHNHRDHVDRKSLQELLEHYKAKSWSQPRVLVPLGDKKLLQTFGFLYINELDWYSKMSVSKRHDLVTSFICIPADQKSGRYQIDHHKSLVTGWIINPEREDVLFKYSGDTRVLSSSTQLAIDAVLFYEISHKYYNIGNPDGIMKIPKIICFEPSGPNYTRCYMESTHQSSSYSALLKFIEAKNLQKISGVPLETFLAKIKTVMFHHNKFELGADRFNEGIFVCKKLYNYLHLDDDELNKEYDRQKHKLYVNADRERLKEIIPHSSRAVIANLPAHTSLLIRAKDFIIRDIINVYHKYEMDPSKLRNMLIGYLVKNTVFPMIGERLNCEQLLGAILNIDVEKYTGKISEKKE